MKEFKIEELGVTITVPDDPAETDSAIVCTYLHKNGTGATIVAGKAENVLPMTMLVQDNIMNDLNQAQKKKYIQALGEHLVEMTKGVDGFEAMIIRKKVDADDDDEDDQL